MVRFIIVSFAFLAFVFYEMSGGADFDPIETRMARIDLPAEITQSDADTAVADASDVAPAPENVTRVSLNLTTVNDVLRPEPTLRTQRARTVTAPDPVLSEEEPTIILPSLISDAALITPVDFGGTEAPAAVTTSDAVTRSVTGSSVNVRGGPGTNFGIVNRLVRGDTVEILENPGNGWVRLRPVGGGQVGWMADFLLSQG